MLYIGYPSIPKLNTTLLYPDLKPNARNPKFGAESRVCFRVTEVVGSGNCFPSGCKSPQRGLPEFRFCTYLRSPLGTTVNIKGRITRKENGPVLENQLDKKWKWNGYWDQMGDDRDTYFPISFPISRTINGYCS